MQSSLLAKHLYTMSFSKAYTHMNYAGCQTVEGLLVGHVRKNETLVVIGETGSGKTTRKLVSVVCFWSKILQYNYVLQSLPKFS